MQQLRCCSYMRIGCPFWAALEGLALGGKDVSIVRAT